MFTTVDNKSKSVIRRNDLRELLFKFMLPIGKEEFTKLWAMYAHNSDVIIVQQPQAHFWLYL